jgi:glutamine amidotransferase
MEVAIVDYGMGNLMSVANAFKTITQDVHIVQSPEDLRQAKRVVLPGVGAFYTGMCHLRDRGWIDALNQAILIEKKPFLGICLGFQLIASSGSEGQPCEGLGWVEGDVKRLISNDDSIRIPHIGWNEIQFNAESKLFNGIGPKEAFYFIHSYHFVAKDINQVSSICAHGEEFTSSIEVDNIFAVQFHPEKSQHAGLKVLNNFYQS